MISRIHFPSDLTHLLGIFACFWIINLSEETTVMKGSAKLQNTPQLWSASLTCVGRLWRSRHNTIDAILIQWHVNELRGILKLLQGIITCFFMGQKSWRPNRQVSFWCKINPGYCPSFFCFFSQGAGVHLWTLNFTPSPLIHCMMYWKTFITYDFIEKNK